MPETIFTKIIKGEIPSVKLYEDDLCLVILDLNPVEKGHALVIAKEPYPTFLDCPTETLSHMMEVAKKVAAKQEDVLSCQGTNILINNGKASGQEVPHLHIHVIPRYEGDGQKFGFSKQSYGDGEMAHYGKELSF